MTQTEVDRRMSSTPSVPFATTCRAPWRLRLLRQPDPSWFGEPPGLGHAGSASCPSTGR